MILQMSIQSKGKVHSTREHSEEALPYPPTALLQSLETQLKTQLFKLRLTSERMKWWTY